jgi:NADH:ubiquinone oxidoreductase subunit H
VGPSKHNCHGFISFELGLLFFWACTRLGVYTVIIVRWSSNSGYSLLGGLHALAQIISYEVRLAFILLSFVVLVCSGLFLFFSGLFVINFSFSSFVICFIYF